MSCFHALTSSQKFIILEPNERGGDQATNPLVVYNEMNLLEISKQRNDPISKVQSQRTRMNLEIANYKSAVSVAKGLTEIELCEKVCPSVPTSFRGTLQVFGSRAISNVRSIPGKSSCTCPGLAEQLLFLQTSSFLHVFRFCSYRFSLVSAHLHHCSHSGPRPRVSPVVAATGPPSQPAPGAKSAKASNDSHIELFWHINIINIYIYCEITRQPAVNLLQLLLYAPFVCWQTIGSRPCWTEMLHICTLAQLMLWEGVGS